MTKNEVNFQPRWSLSVGEDSNKIPKIIKAAQSVTLTVVTKKPTLARWHDNNNNNKMPQEDTETYQINKYT